MRLVCWSIPLWPQRAAIANKYPDSSLRVRHTVPDIALCTSHFDAGLGLRDAPSHLASLGADVAIFPVRFSRERRTGAPLPSLLLESGAPRRSLSAAHSCRFKLIIRSNTRFA